MVAESDKSPDDVWNELVSQAEWHREQAEKHTAEADRIQAHADRFLAKVREAAREALSALTVSSQFALSPEDEPVILDREVTAAEPLPAVAGESRGPGRPTRNELYQALLDVILRQSMPFTNKQIREWLGAPMEDFGYANADSFADAFNAALKRIENEGVIVVVEKPIGRRPGRYRRRVSHLTEVQKEGS